MMVSNKYYKAFMNTARIWAMESYCVKRKVGAVLERGGRIVSTGFNGTAPGDNNVCEHPDTGRTEHHRVIHAEDNALRHAPTSLEMDGTTLWCTTAPCKECALKIARRGVERVVFESIYKNEEGVEELKKNGIPVYQYIGDDIIVPV